MITNKRKVELLAPAGNSEGFYGAIHAGADAVYLGGERFGARAYADNFTTDELIACIRYAHIFGRKVYLTVNTLLKESEWASVYEYIAPFYEAGLDGVIVQDLGVLSLLGKCFLDMELHASTQMTVTGKNGALLLKKMGVCRVVPARELSLKELLALKQDTGLSIETFIHGAMCYCYSGQCLFSSILGGRSGNRGRCAQPCRLPYRVDCGEKRQATTECYPLSLKDMCTIEHIPDLLEAGIDSLKIEGRMKKPEYTAGVTAIYRKYIDQYLTQKESVSQQAYAVKQEDLQKLSQLYIRSEIQDGYYYRKNGADMVTLQNPSYGKNDEALLSQIRRDYIEAKPTLPVDLSATLKMGELAQLTMTQGAVTVTVYGNLVEAAKSQPLTRENVEKQLCKLGGSSFGVHQIEIQMDPSIFYSLKEINELRRKAVRALENEIITANGFCTFRALDKTDHSVESGTVDRKQKTDELVVSVMTREQLEGFQSWLDSCAWEKPIKLIIDAELYMELSQRQALRFYGKMPKATIGLLIALPYVIRKQDAQWLEQLYTLSCQNQEQIQGFQVRSLEGLGFLLQHGYRGEIDTDAGLYMWNRESVRSIKSYIHAFCIPYELRREEWYPLLQEGVPVWKQIYGRIPLMLTANCVMNSTMGCQKKARNTGKKVVFLTDRYHKRFPVCLHCRQCMNVIYNSVPLSLHGEWKKWNNSVVPLLAFTVESAEETKDILTYFATPHQTQPPYQQYTTGHEKRGVE